MILRRGLLEIEFFPYPDLDPYQSSFGACVRVANLDALYTDWLAAKLPDAGIPLEPFGMRMFALVDLNGSLLRCIEEPAD